MNNRYAKNKAKLRKGEYQRGNNTFEYRWTDKHGKRQCVYAKSLPELREKEKAITKDMIRLIAIQMKLILPNMCRLHSRQDL